MRHEKRYYVVLPLVDQRPEWFCSANAREELCVWLTNFPISSALRSERVAKQLLARAVTSYPSAELRCVAYAEETRPGMG